MFATPESIQRGEVLRVHIEVKYAFYRSLLADNHAGIGVVGRHVATLFQRFKKTNSKKRRQA